MTLQRLLLALRTCAFVYLSALIVVVFSERVFWFWTPTATSHVEGAIYYSLPMAVVIGAVVWFRVSSAWGLLLVAPLYAYVTEGVLTPIMYTGGPFDPEMVADVGQLVVLGPWRFSLYVAMCVAFLAAGHLLLGWVWPRTLPVGRRSVRLTTFVVVLGSTLWTFAVPWALPMFVGYGWLQIRALRRAVAGAPPRSLIESMHGRVRPMAVLPLALIVPVASLSYLLVWRADPDDSVLRTIYFGTIAVQTVGGAVVSVLAWRRTSVRVRVPSPSLPPPTRSASFGNRNHGDNRHRTRTIGA